MVLNIISTNKDDNNMLFVFFLVYIQQVFLFYFQSVLHPRYPPILPLWISLVLFVFHVHFKWCTQHLKGRKCLLLILGYRGFFFFCGCNQHCPSRLLFSFFLSLLPSHPILQLDPFRCHIGDMNVHFRLCTVWVCVFV